MDARVQEPIPAVVQLPPEAPGEVNQNAENNADEAAAAAAQPEPTAEEVY